MCTWAYAWFTSRPDVGEYMPMLFIIAMGCDVAIVTAVASAFSKACG